MEVARRHCRNCRRWSATAVVFLRGGLLGGCLAVLVAGTCFSVPFYKTEGRGAADGRPPAAGAAGGAVPRLAPLGTGRAEALGKPEILLVAFLAVLTASTFSHDWQVNNYQPVAWLIVYYLMPAAMYWIARQIKYSERTALAALRRAGAVGRLSGRHVAGRVLSGVVAGVSHVHRHHRGGQDDGVRRPRAWAAVEPHRQRRAAGGLFRQRADVVAAAEACQIPSPFGRGAGVRAGSSQQHSPHPNPLPRERGPRTL